MGPWPHSVNTSTHLGTIEFGPQSMIDLEALQLRWFDHWLKGIDNGIEKEPRAKLFAMGENTWRNETGWPIPGTRFVPWYLGANKTLGTTAPGAEMPDRYQYDPQNPVPFLGADTYAQAGGPDDYRPVEKRSDVLSYTGPAVTAPLKVCGPLKARLFAASSARDTDWTVMLLDVHPDGYSQRLNDGIVRARFRKGRDQEVWLNPESIEEYQIDVWATCQTLLPGHRLRVDISSSANPKFDPNMNTGGPLGRETTGIVASQAIYHDRTHPSQIIIPVAP
jgi:putative CocE/NonD family hydrolase